MRKWRRDLASASSHPVPGVQYASILSGVLLILSGALQDKLLYSLFVMF